MNKILKMFKKLFIVLVVVFFTFSCEEKSEPLWSDKVSLGYFEARGFNLSFREIRTFQLDIINNQSIYGVIRDVTLNIANILIVNSDDVITFGNRKIMKNADNGLHNQIMVNCVKIPINIDIHGATVYGNNTVKHEYMGTCYFLSEFWQNGEKPDFVDPFDKARPGKMVNTMLGKFEFEMRDAMLILKAPAQYSMGIWEGNINPSLPLQGSEVERIVNNGIEGVDWSLFSRDGKTYVRIQNNLYERRFNTWVYAGIADVYLTTSWIREQTWIIFDILDWNDIVKSYVCGYLYNGNYFYTDTRDLPGSVSEKFGDMEDLKTITTPTPFCKK
jgi:hypothetical protein